MVQLSLDSGPARRLASWQQDPLFRRCRRLVLFYLTLCDIDSRETGGQGVGGVPASLFSRLKSKLTQANRASLVIRALYTIAMIRAIIYTHYQATHDYHQLRLERLDVLANTTNNVEPDKARAILEARDYYDRRLDAIGSPYRKADRFTASGSVLVLMALIYVIYDQASVYFSLVRGQFGSSLVGLFLDARGQMLKFALLAERQMESLLDSQTNYLHCQAGEQLHPPPDTGTNGRAAEPRPSVRNRKGSQQARLLAELTRELRHRLERLANSGALWPYTQSIEWARSLGRQLQLNCLINLLACEVLLLFIMLIIPLALDWLHPRTLQDWVSLCELLYLNLLLDLAASFYVSTFFLWSRDRAQYVAGTREQLIDCMRANKRNYDQLMVAERRLTGGGGGGGQRRHSLASLESSLVQRINLELVLALLRYRILLAHSEADKGIFKFAALTALMAPVPPPIIVRLFAIYTYTVIKICGTILCVACIAFSVVVLAPMGNQSYLGETLCKSLFSLVAQTTQIAAQLSEPSRRRLDWHAIGLISRELVHPELIVDKFTTKLFRYQVTYPNIVEAHFYLSLLLVSCLCDAPIMRSLLGSRADDPLWVYIDLG